MSDQSGEAQPLDDDEEKIRPADKESIGKRLRAFGEPIHSADEGRSHAADGGSLPWGCGTPKAAFVRHLPSKKSIEDKGS